MRVLAISIGALIVATGVAAATSVTGEVPGAAGDVRALAQQLRRVHPNVFDEITQPRFASAVDAATRSAPTLDENQLLVTLMRVAALPGARNGHTGIFPGDGQHRRQLHLFPLRLYTFPEGTFVVDALDGSLVGSRVVAIAGIPVASLLAQVAPLVPHDNASSLRGLAPHYVITPEVLAGLGVLERVGPAAFTIERGGATSELSIDPVSAASYLGRFADPHHGHYPASLPHASRPLYLARSDRELWMTTLDRGRVVYVGYNSAQGSTFDAARRLSRLAKRPGVRKVIVDVRLNGGGDNTTYGALVGALRDPKVNRRGRLFLLIGRATFSAAGNFVAEVDASTRATLVGEPTGGGVNQYGDATTYELPATGYNVYIATSYVQVGRPNDPRLTIRPNVTVPLTAKDYFAGKDPVLAAALKR